MSRSQSLSLRRVVALNLLRMLLGVPLAFGAGNPIDPVLRGDPVNADTGTVYVLGPEEPASIPGADGIAGTADDVLLDIIGDTDLVVRIDRPGDEWLPRHILPPPNPAPPQARVGLFGSGTPLPLAIYLSDGVMRAEPEYLLGLPFLAVAFADLDGDGFIGVTHLDGDLGDAEIEAAELHPVGRRFLIGRHGRAAGNLHMSAGGPDPWPLQVVVAAAARAGPFETPGTGCRGCHGWQNPTAPDPRAPTLSDSDPNVFPLGPVILTGLPFRPLLDLDTILLETPRAPGLASADARVAIQALPAWIPDPTLPYGETYTIRLDGSDTRVAMAQSHSGPAATFGLIAPVDRQHYRALVDRPLRPALGALGQRLLVEVLQQLWIADDGAGVGRPVQVQVVALDGAGNVTAPAAPTQVQVTAGPGVRIVAPDADSDDRSETLQVHDTAGVSIELDDRGGAHDDVSVSWLQLEAEGQLSRIRIVSPDPDVTADGQLDSSDADAIRAGFGLRRGDEEYLAALDLDANGAIEAFDLTLFQAAEETAGAPAPPDSDTGADGDVPDEVDEDEEDEEDEDDD